MPLFVIVPGNLGKSPSSVHGRKHTYLNFMLRHENIKDMDLLAKYTLLTVVDVAWNNISTLEALSTMPYLWKVRRHR